ncbi:TPA: hypothetical protein DDW69_03985 [candidate division CPR2 bacterium]|uniref:Nucleoside 2-deoxyribosyltransferase n=1 Tax=candidate division CPR2 bacterium GW2011_GWC1_41_48 TaxID=1618344 RepID=A0A0G0W7G4_UNCC2|nr:MAG: hypothetical protein UT47_C0003G0015 [candidate division CPR2 bacterium GW2011_GWC2_39_35]KKR28885.1 MAG: hypothetical protein UT60_C0010G0003 [candidate division CPR2 bacterium GW2011_GWD2_39_7]KKR29532.1 MAG: hypothetical protein UT59_C0006G0006 [candidate division CPR2 bacterium GW2011_GWD1_39_7]KKS08954.1 MAG: hypothetical protein UU65_C0003G0009 [candidate division CPR2 bacterium GW2011_GWC1_41_48]OGB55745.1 MAG: hypothetical protein A2Y27_01095 [candidate division CPR2 bacterium G
MKAYVTCPISITNQRLPLLAQVKDLVKSKGIDTFTFNIAGTPRHVFEKDYEQLKQSDLLIVEVSEPSHGVGVLIGLSYSLGLKRILLLRKGRSLTKIAPGIPKTLVIEYEDIDDLKEKLDQVLTNIENLSQ